MRLRFGVAPSVCLKTRASWKEATEVNIAGQNNSPIHYTFEWEFGARATGTGIAGLAAQARNGDALTIWARFSASSCTATRGAVEAELVAQAKLDQKLNDLITERMAHERLPDAHALAVAEGRVEPFVGPSGELRWRKPMKVRRGARAA